MFKGVKENLINIDCLLEIGPGRGYWSKYIYDLNAVKKQYCVDVLSAEHNNFWNYVGNKKQDKIEYHEVKDFSLDCIPDNSLDYVFSYDVFCHISRFLPYDNGLSLHERGINGTQYATNSYIKYKSNKDLINAAINDCDGKPISYRWYWVGIDNFINLSKKYNYKVLNKDLNIDKTNPITLFHI